MNPNQLVPERTNAIPCQYKGINFRSLLEARWAYFFDKLGWTWQYEPFEMDGYIPDFLVTLPQDIYTFIVDIKPFFTLDYQKNVIEKCNLYSEQYSLLFVSTPSIKTHNTRIDDCKDKEIEIKYYNIGKCSHLNETPVLDAYVDNINKDRIFLINGALFEVNPVARYEPPFRYYTDLITDGKLTNYLWKSEDTICVNYHDYNAMISQLESYWAEAQNATQYKPKKPQQFIQESTQGSKESELEIILPFGTKYSK